MIIIYPADNWNSFVDVSTADIKMAEIGNADWATSTKKEELLINSANYIKAYFTVKAKKCPYVESQIALINLDMVNGDSLLSGVVSSNKYKSAKVGSLRVEYADSTSSNSDIPSLIKAILGNCLKGGDNKVTRFTY